MPPQTMLRFGSTDNISKRTIPVVDPVEQSKRESRKIGRNSHSQQQPSHNIRSLSEESADAESGWSSDRSHWKPRKYTRNSNRRERVPTDECESRLNSLQNKELEKVKQSFKVAEETLDTTNWISHRIELADEAKKLPPVRINPFPNSPKRQEQINEELNRMLERKIIEKSYSDWALRLVPVDKPDGSTLYLGLWKKLHKFPINQDGMRKWYEKLKTTRKNIKISESNRGF
ncbi:uncharacterized protein LOC128746440 [Sabethes cyaneus]|uniref:uncharacterized protein LOC128746440 n=1 Tax=Sabethes cyaneus TaxID=53552 RepID=UPI00237D6466|nr:uncharacterized protein LOC128746440 [Sabethes cyaneus]